MLKVYLGRGVNAGIGAFAFDVTQSHASIDDLGAQRAKLPA